MSNYDRNAAIPDAPADRTSAVDAGLRAHMLRVYNYMAVGVGLTGLVAMLTYQFTGPELLQSPLMWVFMLAPLALVFFISARINKLSAETARLLFFVYAALVGLSLSTIFHVYTGASITRVFFISAATFGALSIWGYTTRRDLSGFGMFLFMGVIGIVIASLVNLFLEVQPGSTGSSPSLASASLRALPPTTPSGSRGCTTAATMPLPRAVRL